MLGKLYGFPFSQPTRSVLLLAREANLNIEFKQINLFQGEQKKKPFLENINPAGKIPAYVEGDFRLGEGAAILTYLCESRALSQWLPEDARERATVNQWLHWNHTNTRKGTTKIVAAQFFGRTVDVSGFKQAVSHLDKHLESNKFVASTIHPTIADLMLLPELDQLLPECLNAIDYAPFPNTLRYIEDMRSALPNSYTENWENAVKSKKIIVEALSKSNIDKA